MNLWCETCSLEDGFSMYPHHVWTLMGYGMHINIYIKCSKEFKLTPCSWESVHTLSFQGKHIVDIDSSMRFSHPSKLFNTKIEHDTHMNQYSKCISYSKRHFNLKAFDCDDAVRSAHFKTLKNQGSTGTSIPTAHGDCIHSNKLKNGICLLQCHYSWFFLLLYIWLIPILGIDGIS